MALERARYVHLDTIGIATAAEPRGAGDVANDALSPDRRLSDHQDSARVFFDGPRVSIADVHADATQSDNFDARDRHAPTTGHAGEAVSSALSAPPEERPELPEPEALAALVVGYKFSGHARRSLYKSVRGRHTPGAWSVFGEAADAAPLWRLPGKPPRQAPGIVENRRLRSPMTCEIVDIQAASVGA
jgi:hypothetical protein